MDEFSSDFLGAGFPAPLDGRLENEPGRVMPRRLRMRSGTPEHESDRRGFGRPDDVARHGLVNRVECGLAGSRDIFRAVRVMAEQQNLIHRYRAERTLLAPRLVPVGPAAAQTWDRAIGVGR